MIVGRGWGRGGICKNMRRGWCGEDLCICLCVCVYFRVFLEDESPPLAALLTSIAEQSKAMCLSHTRSSRLSLASTI